MMILNDVIHAKFRIRYEKYPIPDNVNMRQYILIKDHNWATALPLHFHQFVIELWPLFGLRIFRSLFPLNIYRTNWWNWPNFGFALILKRSRLRLLRFRFSQSHNRVMALEWCQNFVSSEYPLNILKINWWNLTKFCMSIDTDNIEIEWDC